MLIGIPGDNTYSNYQEATRTFWRSTVLPLVTRTAKSLSSWLAPSYAGVTAGSDPAGLTPSLHGGLELRPDIDSIEALSIEREALWTRVDKATFLTQNEKRAAVGYGPIDGGDALSQKAGFRVDQPRVPARQPGGGQWVGEGGGGLVHLTQGDPLSGYPIDLREEDRRGGHIIDEHVNVNPEYLATRVRQEAEKIRERGDDFRGLSIGSFTSLAAATRLVNSTVSQGQGLVNEVAQGRRAFAILEARFDSVTGYESYLATYHAQPYTRDTYGVRVFILRDGRTPRGYRVQSAFPIR
jgi:hypothetical protein